MAASNCPGQSTEAPFTASRASRRARWGSQGGDWSRPPPIYPQFPLGFLGGCLRGMKARGAAHLGAKVLGNAELLGSNFRGNLVGGRNAWSTAPGSAPEPGLEDSDPPPTFSRLTQSLYTVLPPRSLHFLPSPCATPPHSLPVFCLCCLPSASSHLNNREFEGALIPGSTPLPRAQPAFPTLLLQRR